MIIKKERNIRRGKQRIYKERGGGGSKQKRKRDRKNNGKKKVF